MTLRSQLMPLVGVVALFLVFYYLPANKLPFPVPIVEALALARWYAREHVILCLLPAFFIAGGIAVFVSQASVMRYLGAGTNKLLSYGVASVSGSVLAVCSCTVLPLFAGIYRMGAGIGPATAFLYAGPAVNVLAIILTARVLGLELGIARGIGAILFSVVIGLIMQAVYRKEERSKAEAQMALPEQPVTRGLGKTALYFGAMLAILVFASWGKPDNGSSFWTFVYNYKWIITGFAAGVLGLILTFWFNVPRLSLTLTAVVVLITALLFPQYPTLAFVIGAAGLAVVLGRDRGEPSEWLAQTWGFAKQILPLLFGGVLVAGLLLGRPGGTGLIPAGWISGAVGGNSPLANFLASVVGAFMYFATLTEVPILQGLLDNGMGKGPALALLLAGPALSLPNMLVIRSIMGTGRTVVFVTLVIVMATISGIIYGSLF